MKESVALKIVTYLSHICFYLNICLQSFCSYLPVFGLCLFLKKLVQVSLIQCLIRKLERINKEMQLILQVYGLHILEGRYMTDILHATNQ